MSERHDSGDGSPRAGTGDGAVNDLIVRLGDSVITVAAQDGQVSIGRTIDNEIVVDSESVSAQHATLRVVDGHWELVDHSTYGTFFGGDRITQVRINESMEFRLADSVNGAVMRIDPLVLPLALPPSKSDSERVDALPERRENPIDQNAAVAPPSSTLRVPAIVVSSLVVLGLIAVAVAVVRTPDEAASPEIAPIGTVIASNDAGDSVVDAEPDSTPSADDQNEPDPQPTNSFDIQAIIDNVLRDSEELVEPEVSESRPALFVSDVRPGEPDPEAVRNYLAQSVAHLDTVWTNWFLENGFNEPWVSYTVVMPGPPTASACDDLTILSDYKNALYCPVDLYSRADGSTFEGGIYLPVDTMALMWTGDIFGRHVADLKRTGDFAAATLAAHEFGHHVQDELSQQAGIGSPDRLNAEQIADCFAGVWTYAVFLDGYLEDGDIDEAIGALGVIGDADVTVQSHGTAIMRQNAFQIGYQGSQANPTPGLPSNCIAAFWPEWSSSQ